jgi:hypothetical protein
MRDPIQRPIKMALPLARASGVSAALRAAAFHEAGHAVIGIARFNVAMGIDIANDGSGLSHSSGKRLRPWEEIKVTLAGPLAEARCRKVSILDVYRNFGWDDYQLARTKSEWWAAAVSVARESVFREAEENARRWLKVYWPAVERVAQAAVHRRCLSSSEVAELAAIT